MHITNNMVKYPYQNILCILFVNVIWIFLALSFEAQSMFESLSDLTEVCILF